MDWGRVRAARSGDRGSRFRGEPRGCGFRPRGGRWEDGGAVDHDSWWTCGTSFAGEDGGGWGVLTEILGARGAVWLARKARTLPSPGVPGEGKTGQAVSGMKVGMLT